MCSFYLETKRYILFPLTSLFLPHPLPRGFPWCILRPCCRVPSDAADTGLPFSPIHIQVRSNASSKIDRRDYVLDGTLYAKFCSDRFRGFCSPNTWFCRAFGVTMFVFWGSSIRLQPTPLDGYLREIRQMTSFRVRKCLLGVPMTIFYIWTLKFSKNRHFGDRFWLDLFFCGRKPL